MDKVELISTNFYYFILTPGVEEAGGNSGKAVFLDFFPQ